MFPVECVARGYLTGSGLLDYAATGEVCGIAAAGRPGRRQPAARADLHPRHQGRPRRPRRERVLRRRRRHRRRRGRRDAARPDPRRLRPRRGPRPRARHHPGRHQARARPPPRRHRRARRRGAHPRLLPVLAGRRWAARAAPQPSYDKQIVRNWALSPESGWDRASGEAPPPLPRRGGRAHPRRATSRPTSCSPGSAGSVARRCASRSRCEEAYDYLVDPANRAEWQSSLKARRRRRRPERRRRPDLDRRHQGRRPPADGAHRRRPPRTAGPSAAPGAASPPTLTLTFTPVGSFCDVDSMVDVQARGLARPFGLVVDRLAPAAIRGDLKRAAAILSSR